MTLTDNHRIECVPRLLIFALFMVGCASPGVSEPSSDRPDRSGENRVEWTRNKNNLALKFRGRLLWRLNYNRAKDKPYFHPLRTPSGRELVLFRPDDHPWHRGLWFSWKRINGVNYWEEDPDTGLSEGRSKIKDVNVSREENGSARVRIKLAYRPGGQPVVLTEDRTISVSAPRADPGRYTIDWTMTFTARTEVKLDRKPPLEHGGVRWGGYAGLSYRASDRLTDLRYLNSHGWSRKKSLIGGGERANWMDLSGTVKGTNRKAGLAMFDHPENPRHPSPWYVWYKREKHAFFTPAFLFHKPYRMESGESLTLKYRVWIHDGKPGVDRLSEAYEQYLTSGTRKSED